MVKRSQIGKPEHRFIPLGSHKLASRKSSAVVYLYSRGARPLAIGYAGKAVKPAFHHSYASAEKRMASVASFLKSHDASAVAAVERLAAKKAKMAEPHKLKLGSVLRASWGYDQTNIDYFEVVELVGKRGVKIREICAESIEGQHFMQGECVPLPGSYKSEAMLKRVSESGDSVKIFSFAHAYLVEPVMVAGKPVGYKPSHWTAYA